MTLEKPEFEIYQFMWEVDKGDGAFQRVYAWLPYGKPFSELSKIEKYYSPEQSTLITEKNKDDNSTLNGKHKCSYRAFLAEYKNASTIEELVRLRERYASEGKDIKESAIALALQQEKQWVWYAWTGAIGIIILAGLTFSIPENANLIESIPSIILTAGVIGWVFFAIKKQDEKTDIRSKWAWGNPIDSYLGMEALENFWFANLIQEAIDDNS